MAEDRDDAQRTEEPTPRKLEEAREQGRVATSRDVASFLLLGLAALIAGGSMPVGMQHLTGSLAGLLAHAHERADDGALGRHLIDIMVAAGGVLALPLGGAVLLAILASLAQHGPLFTPAALMPQFGRVSPMAGFGRLVSVNAVVELVRSCIKIAIVSGVAFTSMRGHLDQVLAMAAIDLHGLLPALAAQTSRLLVAAAGVAALAAVADVLWQRFSLMRQLRMTRQEVLDDHKHSDGNPVIKQRLRSLRMARARQRMMADVPKATVVITNPTHVAVALRYAAGETAAPVVVAKGVDAVAAKIRALALDHGIPLVANPPLARLLHKSVDVGDAIPPAQYQAVAEIVGYVMRLRERNLR